MATRPSINARQRQVLQRIVDGEEPLTRADSTFITTINALSTRKLVIKRRGPGGMWTAEATDLGRAALHPTPADAPRRGAPPAIRGPKVVTRGGLPIVEAVELPARWPVALEPTVRVLQAPTRPGQERRFARGQDLVVVDVNVELAGRALQVLWLFAQNLTARHIPWVHITAVPIRMGATIPDEGHHWGTLAVGSQEAPLFLALREVGWWRPNPGGRVGMTIGNRTWSERRLSDGRHCIDLEGALGDVDQMLEKGRLMTVRQQEAAAREQELDALYAAEREQGLRDDVVRWQMDQLRSRIREDADRWEAAERVRRFGQAIHERHGDDPRWRRYEALVTTWAADRLDPLSEEPPELFGEPEDYEVQRLAARWPEKRPTYWQPTPRRRRGRRR